MPELRCWTLQIALWKTYGVLASSITEISTFVEDLGIYVKVEKYFDIWNTYLTLHWPVMLKEGLERT